VGRRAVLRALLPAVAVPGVLLAACTPPRPSGQAVVDPAARLTARPVATSGTLPPPVPGRHVLDLGPGPEVLLHVPASAGGAEPARLVLCLHGAGQGPREGLASLIGLAQAHRLLLLAPASHGVTWDAVADRWGEDVRHIDRALAAVLATHPVDPQHLVISGFSDGASYALSLGLANADLFTHVIAFSPGSLLDGPRVGTPRVFVSHGLADEILPIDDSTRRIVTRLDADRVPTEVRVFDGPHIVPPDIAEAAVRWLLA
jgi:phospholipase/carboxylesterase